MIPRDSARIWIERVLVGLGVLCLMAYGVVAARAAAFQRTERAVLTHRLEAGQVEHPGEIVGLLEAPRIGMSVIVVDAEDPQTLMHAAGHLRGTALPWESGNTGIAAHRDTYFQTLRYVRVGDALRLTTTRGTFDYRVRDIRIVQPTDVSVLAPTRETVLTLVTCYPFSFLGPAPQRFIVRADREARYNHDQHARALTRAAFGAR